MLKNLSRRDISILIGNTLDHFDTSLYSFLAPVMAGIFFPKAEPPVQLILAYSILATSLFTRPVGAFIFGSIARNRGALTGLSYSLIGVAITTFLMGCIPEYQQIGFFAPLSLILIRMVRGIFAAGESTIAKLYILEEKENETAMESSYLYQSSSILGIILASAFSTLIIYLDFKEGWRIGFWLGGTTGFVGYGLRRFKEPKNAQIKNSLASYTVSGLGAIWHNKRKVLHVAAVTSLSHLTYSIPFVVMNSFVPLVTKISLKSMMALNTALLIFDMLFIPLIGRFIRKVLPYNIMYYSALLLAISIVPLWYFIEGASLWYVTLLRFWIVTLGIAFLCPLNVWLKSILSTPDQYLLTGMGGALSAATIGRLTPSVCLSLWYFTGSPMSIAVYIACVALITVVVLRIKGR